MSVLVLQALYCSTAQGACATRATTLHYATYVPNLERRPGGFLPSFFWPMRLFIRKVDWCYQRSDSGSGGSEYLAVPA
ncbi:uncharacterized protein BDW70DRAFT_136815 [Aspergillus foveolatus]|uniref:uncharacterized protein n=1 Tax=Aspergillus foveolatus TaxID=210207 RepID=UPI003CCE2BD5